MNVAIAFASRRGRRVEGPFVLAGVACWRARARCSTAVFVVAKSARWKAATAKVNTILALATAIETDWPARTVSRRHQERCSSVQFDAQQKRVLAAELLRFAIRGVGGETH